MLDYLTDTTIQELINGRRFCFQALACKPGLALVIEGEAGYVSLNNHEFASSLNRLYGISEEQSLHIVMQSMRKDYALHGKTLDDDEDESEDDDRGEELKAFLRVPTQLGTG